MTTIAIFTTKTPQPGKGYINLPVSDGVHFQAHIVKMRAEVVTDLDDAHARALPTETVLNTIEQ